MTDDNDTDDAARDEPFTLGDRDDGRPERSDPTDGDSDAENTPGEDRDGRDDDSAPLSDLAGRVAERRTRSHVSDQGDDVDELFESVEVGELDRDDVWTSLVEGGDDVEAEGIGVGVGAEATPVDDGEGVADHVVPKTEFCQRCEHFAAPPELACHHEGTTIVELEDSDHFRVRNCPMVEQDD
ncbi:hypothetical protein [Haloferax volcanii]|uniref:hypothetical protein n=1 Tax=Haloferax volcanii TaxID=2246 RepID=UPI003D301A85